MIGTILLFGGAAALAGVLGGAVFVARRTWPQSVQGVLLALGAGFLLALVFLKLIPESMARIGVSASLYVLLGFAVIHFFEHTVAGHLHFGEETHADVMVSRTASLSALGGLLVHAFFDGLSISAGLQFDYLLGVLVFVAITLHKIPEGLTVGSIMVAAGFSRTQAFQAAVAIGFSTLLGATSMLVMAAADPELVGSALAFSGGVAAYVGASDLIPEINRSGSRRLPVVVLVGMLVFYGTEVLLSSFTGH